MKWRKRSRIALSGTGGIEPRSWLVIDAGSAHEEMVQVTGVSRRRGTVTIGRWRWYDTLRSRVRHPVRTGRGAARTVRRFACGLRGHRPVIEESGAWGTDWPCRCGERHEDDGSLRAGQA